MQANKSEFTRIGYFAVDSAVGNDDTTTNVTKCVFSTHVQYETGLPARLYHTCGPRT